MRPEKSLGKTLQPSLSSSWFTNIQEMKQSFQVLSVLFGWSGGWILFPSTPTFPSKLSYFFLSLRLRWVCVAACRLSLAAASQGYPLVALCRLLSFSLQWPPFSWASVSGAWVQLLPPSGLVASQTRDWTCVPCMCRQTLNHWTTREVP